MHWTPATPESVRSFSSTAYYTARELLSNRATPLGLIRASLGGTQIQLWSSPDALQKCGHKTSSGPFWRNYSSLFGKMIMPLARLQLSGVVYYQGEANVGPDEHTNPSWGTGPTGPKLYSCTLPNLIRDWKAKFHDDKLPFFVVELGAYCVSLFAPPPSSPSPRGLDLTT